jgi:hypothetical protein
MKRIMLAIVGALSCASVIADSDVNDILHLFSNTCARGNVSLATQVACVRAGASSGPALDYFEQLAAQVLAEVNAGQATEEDARREVHTRLTELADAQSRRTASPPPDAVLIDMKPAGTPAASPGFGFGAELQRAKVLCYYRASDGSVFVRQGMYTCPNKVQP